MARLDAAPQQPFPYDTHLDIKFPPLQVVDVQPLVDACTHPWHNQTLCRVNDSVVRLGVLKGEYHWHQHDTEDEFFYVVEGPLPDRSASGRARGNRGAVAGAGACCAD